MNYFDQQQLRRTEAYPTAQCAADYLCDVATRLKELGFRFGHVPDDDRFYEAFEMNCPLLHRRGGNGFPREQLYWWRQIGGGPTQEEILISAEKARNMLVDFSGHFGDNMFKRRSYDERF